MGATPAAFLKEVSLPEPGIPAAKEKTAMDSDFSLLIGYQDFEPGRRSFNALARKTFGLDFEPWYRSGYWTKQYIPYSLSRAGEVVSSVSVNFMPMTLEGTAPLCRSAR